MHRARLALALAASISSLAFVHVAHANPMALPFTYTYDTLPEGEAEMEQYVDFTPAAGNDPSQGTRRMYGATQFQTEFEYGITDHLELGLYFAYEPHPDPGTYGNTSPLTEGTGLKERLRYRIADEGKLPIDVALYGEVVEYETELELEAKILLQKRFGNLRVDVNLWGEREWGLDGVEKDWVLNPTAGFTYQVTPVVNLGIEGWMHGEFPDHPPHPHPFNLGPHEYVGPVYMLNFGKLWWSLGVYARLDDVGRSPQPGDSFGSVWVRSVVGFGL